MELYLQILLFFIPKIHINENLLFKCRRPLPIMQHYIYITKHSHMKISMLLFHIQLYIYICTHTQIIYVSSQHFSTYTYSSSGEKLGNRAIPMLSSLGTVEPLCMFFKKIKHINYTTSSFRCIHDVRIKQGPCYITTVCFSKKEEKR